MTWRAVNAISIAVMGAGTSYGEVSAPSLPNWQIADICAKESAPGAMGRVGSEAPSTVSATWAFVADALKRTCFTQLQPPMDRSWQLLTQCIDAEAFKARDKTAVETGKTSGEPMPAPRPSSPEAAAFPTKGAITGR
jgi:hypothetical protein